MKTIKSNMGWKDFFKLTKIKIIYLVIIAIIIIISGILSQSVIECIRAPCNQLISTIISQKVYSIVTFGELFINTSFSLQIKNLLNQMFSAGTIYLILSLIISIILHYFLISIIIYFYNNLRIKLKKNKTKK